VRDVPGGARMRDWVGSGINVMSYRFVKT
jgi:hypothetical protein